MPPRSIRKAPSVALKKRSSPFVLSLLIPRRAKSWMQSTGPLLFKPFEDRVGTFLCVLMLIWTAGGLSYFELLDHVELSDHGVSGLIGHAAFYGSLAICTLIVGDLRYRPEIICTALTILAAILETLEIIATAPGSLTSWLASVAAIWIVYGLAKLGGRFGADVFMVLSGMLTGIGFLCAWVF